MKELKPVSMVLAALLLFSLMPLAFAQENEEDGEQTVEQLYLQSQVKVKIIRAEADSVDRDMKLFALKDIEKMIEDGEIGEDNEEMIGILSSLGTEGINNQVIEQGEVINNFPIVRTTAVRLLGEVGGDEARKALINVLRTDNEPMVLSEAAVALSKVGPDEQGAALAVLSDTMRSQTALNKDNNFANAYILAMETLAENNGGIDDVTVFEELAKIANPRSGYITVVRKKAFELLKNLQNY